MEAFFTVPFSRELEDGVAQLQRYLLHVKVMKNYSTILVEEIRTFVEALNENLGFLKTHLPPTDSKKALGSLVNEMKDANTFMVETLQRGKFTGLWTDKEVRSNLESRKQKLVSAFQMAFMTTSLDVMFDRCRKVDNFHERINEIYSVHTSDAAAARTQIQDLLQPLVSRMSVQDEKNHNLISHVKNGLNMIVQRNYRFATTKSTDIQEFFVDVLAAVQQQQDEYQLEELMYDIVYPNDLMWDPVKASDGFTYDRWSIVENDDHPARRSLEDGRSPSTRAPLTILCDDVTVRQRLFSMKKFGKEELETKCKEMREKYRTKTLELVMEEQDGEALERLGDVLQWAPDDEVCRKHQDAISLRLGKSQVFPAKLVEESLRALIEDLQRQAKLDETKIQLLERKSSELEASLSEAKEEAERRCILLEQRSRHESELNDEKLQLLESQAFSAKSIEEDLRALIEDLHHQAKLDVTKIQLLERKSSELETSLSEAKEEAERKHILLEQHSRRESELNEELRLLESQASPLKPVEALRALIQDLHHQAKLDGKKIQLLERKSTELGTSLPEAEEEAVRKSSEFETSLFEVEEEEAEMKLILLEQHSRRESELNEEKLRLLESQASPPKSVEEGFRAVIEDHHQAKLDGRKIQLLERKSSELETSLPEAEEEGERKSSELETCLSEAKEEAERKCILLEQHFRRESELNEGKPRVLESQASPPKPVEEGFRAVIEDHHQGKRQSTDRGSSSSRQTGWKKTKKNKKKKSSGLKASLSVAEEAGRKRVLLEKHSRELLDKHESELNEEKFLLLARAGLRPECSIMNCNHCIL